MTEVQTKPSYHYHFKTKSFFRSCQHAHTHTYSDIMISWLQKYNSWINYEHVYMKEEDCVWTRTIAVIFLVQSLQTPYI